MRTNIAGDASHAPAAGAAYGNCPLPLAKEWWVGVWRALRHATANHYRPEAHYMRGPGPKWREKFAAGEEPAMIGVAAGGTRREASRRWNRRWHGSCETA